MKKKSQGSLTDLFNMQNGCLLPKDLMFLKILSSFFKKLEMIQFESKMILLVPSN